jgi:hypothetical protein
MECPSAPSKYTWADHISAANSLIEQMKKYPQGSSDLLDQMEAARGKEIDNLENPNKRSRK